MSLHHKRIDEAGLQQMLATGNVIEADANGPKVVILADGTFLKLFRVRNRWSLAWVYPYSRRFCDNAEGLRRLGYPTVDLQAHLQLGGGVSGVLYRPLPGSTLRELIGRGLLDSPLCRQVGEFIARLHEDGVYFRSLHSGNIVLTPDNDLGLIDVADMRFLRGPLSSGMRRRNWRHLFRYAEDFAGDAFVLTEMFAAYGIAASRPTAETAALEAQFRRELQQKMAEQEKMERS